jgi:hypothetical protein
VPRSGQPSELFPSPRKLISTPTCSPRVMFFFAYSTAGRTKVCSYGAWLSTVVTQLITRNLDRSTSFRREPDKTEQSSQAEQLLEVLHPVLGELVESVPGLVSADPMACRRPRRSRRKAQRCPPLSVTAPAGPKATFSSAGGFARKLIECEVGRWAKICDGSSPK